MSFLKEIHVLGKIRHEQDYEIDEYLAITLLSTSYVRSTFPLTI